MNGLDGAALAAQIAMGLTLAACAGLRAFLPPLAVGVAARAGFLDLSPGFAWLGETPALVALTAAVVFELLGDKIPAVDNLLDTAGTFLRPAAGALAAAAPIFAVIQPAEDAGPAGPLTWVAGATTLAAGASLSVLVHLVKSAVRLASTSLTAGLANPILSLVEDAAGLMGVLAAFIAPFAALALLAAMLAAGGMLIARRARRSLGRAPGG